MTKIRKAQGRDLEKAWAIRHEVFVFEQNVPVALEHDGLDGDSTHYILLDDQGYAIGTARLRKSAHAHKIERVAILKDFRGHGYGRMLVEHIIKEIYVQESDAEIILSAQIPTVPFYKKLGFVPFGETFEEAAIPHRKMRYTKTI